MRSFVELARRRASVSEGTHRLASQILRRESSTFKDPRASETRPRPRMKVGRVAAPRQEIAESGQLGLAPLPPLRTGSERARV